jgi:hypothetical protein
VSGSFLPFFVIFLVSKKGLQKNETRCFGEFGLVLKRISWWSSKIPENHHSFYCAPIDLARGDHAVRGDSDRGGTTRRRKACGGGAVFTC